MSSTAADDVEQLHVGHEQLEEPQRVADARVEPCFVCVAWQDHRHAVVDGAMSTFGAVVTSAVLSIGTSPCDRSQDAAKANGDPSRIRR